MTTTLTSAITVSPLRQNDTATVQAIFEQLGERSRRLRFGGVKPKLTPRDLMKLAEVDGQRRHALVAYAGCAPVGLADLARDDDDPRSAEIGLAVVDLWQGLGVGTQLVRQLAIDARAAGIDRVHASIDFENRASRSLMRAETTIIRTRYEPGALDVTGLLEGRPRERP
jgi:RimJ/RimL family protein N-acetyltransferase